MSASREKKMRQEQSTSEVTSESVSKKGMSKTTKTVLIAAAAVILVAAIVFLGMVSTGFFASHSTAAVVSGHKLTPGMFNYYYNGAYSNDQFISYLTDSSIPLSEQEFTMGDEYDTWADYVTDNALTQAANTYAIYDEAVANGFTLSEEDQETIENNMSYLELMASYNGMKTDAFLSYQYGDGCNAKNYREYLTVAMTAQGYAEQVYNDFTYTQDQLDEYYAANTEDFDGVSYRLFAFTVSSESEDPAADLAAYEEQAKAMAEEAEGNEQTFIDLALENAPEEKKESYESDPNVTLHTDVTKSTLAELYHDWLADGARKSGDTTYISDGETYVYVLYFVENVDHSYQLPNVRHILVSVDDTSDEEAMATAKEEVQAILDEFLAGEQSEDAFIALANEKSDDTATMGDLMENIMPGQTVEGFDDWCFDTARQVGDVDIVETTYGYHVVYFSGFGRVYQDYSVENTLRQNDYQAWNEGVTADATYSSRGFGMIFVNI